MIKIKRHHVVATCEASGYDKGNVHDFCVSPMATSTCRVLVNFLTEADKHILALPARMPGGSRGRALEGGQGAKPPGSF